jgi:hypothetical protein
MMTDFRGRSSYRRVIETALWVIDVTGGCIWGDGLIERTGRLTARWNKSSSDLPFRSRFTRKLGFGRKSLESAQTLEAIQGHERMRHHKTVLKHPGRYTPRRMFVRLSSDKFKAGALNQYGAGRSGQIL